MFKSLNGSKKINLYIWRLIKIKRYAKVYVKGLVMYKNNLNIPLKVVTYIFISITALDITSASYVIT